MTSIPLTSLPSTKLFHDFLDGADAIWTRFEHRNVTDEFIAQRARHGASRKRLVALVEASMHGIVLSDQQQASLTALGNNAVVVTTGQQIGLFGGPLYTLLKIGSAVALAKELAAATTSASAPAIVPVFWLEDNDHDAEEASSTVLPDGSAPRMQSTWDGSRARMPVAQRTFSSEEIERIHALIPQLGGPFDADVHTLLEGVYEQGAAWADAFVRLLQPFLAAWGVLVVRGSEVIKAGLHAPILERDLGAPGAMSDAIRTASEALIAAGYHVQATPGHVLFFRHDADGRQRITEEDLSTDAVRVQAREHAELFSPNALARPIVQDAVLPTIAVVLGPAEIAYHAQLREAYALCGVPMPVPFNRHSATLIDAKTQRNLAKDGLEVQTLMRPWQSIEAELVAALTHDAVPEVDESAELLEKLFLPYVGAAESIDKTLSAAVLAGQTSVRNTLETLRGKLRSALKRKNSEQLDRRRAMHGFLYPLDSPQERNYPVAFFVGRFGIAGLRIIVEVLTANRRSDHLLIGSDDHTNAQ